MNEPDGARPDFARDRAVAGLLLSLLLLGAALPPAPRPSRPCERPREIAQVGSRSTIVSCESAGASQARVRGPARLLFGLRLDLNRASAETLQVLPGIGPRRAAAIVAARTERPFQRVSDLRRISGIGPRTVARLAGSVQVEPSARSADR